MPSEAEPVTIEIDCATKVSGLLQKAPEARACFVLAHGAGAGMTHPFMAAVAAGLAERNIATLRYQFPYMERGGKRPDPPKAAHTPFGPPLPKHRVCSRMSGLSPAGNLSAGG